jgi:hypothetical protein
LRIEVELGFNLLDIARTEYQMSDRVKARKSVAHARASLNQARRALARCTSLDNKTRRACEANINELATAILRVESSNQV